MLALVFTFRTANALAYAYGVAVTGTITITTLLFFYIVRSQWKKPLWLVLPAAAVLHHHRPAVLRGQPHQAAARGLAAARHRRRGVHRPHHLAEGAGTRQPRARRDEGSLREFIDELHNKKPPLPRVPGTGIFLNRGKETAPLALRANVEHNHVLHDQVIILAIATLPVPHVPAKNGWRSTTSATSDDRIYHVTAHFGYMDTPAVPALLPLIRKDEGKGALDDAEISYFLSTIEMRAGNTPGMSRWRKRLFIATARLTADAAEYFQLPRDRTVIMGARIEL